MRVKTQRIILVIISAVILMGAGIMTCVLHMWHEDDLVKVAVRSGEPHLIDLEGFAIVPGYEKEYKVRVITEKKSYYDLTFEFKDLAPKDDPLKDNLYVKIEHNGTVYYDDKLATFYEKDNMGFVVDMSKTYHTDLSITYYIPLEVGNEIQGCEVDFQLYITAQEKGD